MNMHCLMCAGSGKIIGGKPCPECSGKEKKSVPLAHGIPLQYQGITFDKEFLPEKLKKPYGEFMENLLTEITENVNIYQKNLLICSKPNSGKTIWAYNIYAYAINKGITMAPVKDILEIRNILNSYSYNPELEMIAEARGMIVKIPKDIQPWIFDSISTLIERRVRNNGFTIFLYGGQEEDLKQSDRNGRLSEIKGNGSFNTLRVYNFY